MNKILLSALALVGLLLGGCGGAGAPPPDVATCQDYTMQFVTQLETYRHGGGPTALMPMEKTLDAMLADGCVVDATPVEKVTACRNIQARLGTRLVVPSCGTPINGALTPASPEAPVLKKLATLLGCAPPAAAASPGCAGRTCPLPKS